MSLGIFSFDFAAMFNSLADLLNTPEPEIVEPTIGNISSGDNSLDKMTNILQNSTGADSALNDLLMATALSNVTASVVSSTENSKQDNSDIKIPVPVPIVSVPTVKLDDKTKEEIDQLIRSLQTQVIYSYQSPDIIGEKMSMNKIADFSKRESQKEAEKKSDLINDDRKKEDLKMNLLKAELRKAILKNNSDV